MTEDEGSKVVPPWFSDERALEWMAEHLPELRQSASGQRILYQSLAISFVVGLCAHIGGYVLLSLVPSGLLGLLADLLHALGWSLWTGVVVVVFIQVIPEAKRRQIRQAVAAYEGLRRDKPQARGNHEEGVSESSHTRRAGSGQNQGQSPKRVRKGR
jgi:hypothetical protein